MTNVWKFRKRFKRRGEVGEFLEVYSAQNNKTFPQDTNVEVNNVLSSVTEDGSTTHLLI